MIRELSQSEVNDNMLLCCLPMEECMRGLMGERDA